MLVKRLVTRVDIDQPFYYAGRKYLLANEQERRKHPASGSGDAVLAWHVPERDGRIPVSFNPLTEVFVEQR